LRLCRWLSTIFLSLRSHRELEQVSSATDPGSEYLVSFNLFLLQYRTGLHLHLRLYLHCIVSIFCNCTYIIPFIFERDINNIPFFLFGTYNRVSITLKRVSKRRSFRYAFQEHLLKFLMLAVTHSEWLLRDHCTSRHFKFKTYNCSSIYQRCQPLFLPSIIFLALCFELFLNLRGKIEKILYCTRFISHFVALVCL
jgi:hypothetical protein